MQCIQYFTINIIKKIAIDIMTLKQKTLTQSKAYLILPITMCERFHNMKEPDNSICQLSHSIKGDMLTY